MPEVKIRPVINGLKETKELITFSGLALFTYIGYLLFSSTDSIIISNINELGPEKIIVYNIAQRWDPNIRQFLLGFTFAIAPMVTSLAASSDLTKFKRPFFRGLRYCMILGLFPICMFYVYADEFITLWINNVMAHESAPVLRITMLNLACCLPMMLSLRFFMALAKLKGVTIVTITGGILNIGLSILLVKIFKLGIWGVGLSTFITLGLANLIFVPIFVNLYLKISIKEFFINGLMKSIITILGVAAFAYSIKYFWFASSWIRMLSQITLSGAVYVILTYIITFVDEDREKIKEYSSRSLDYIKKSISMQIQS